MSSMGTASGTAFERNGSLIVRCSLEFSRSAVEKAIHFAPIRSFLKGEQKLPPKADP